MIVQPFSALISNAAILRREAPPRQDAVIPSANTAETVSISRAARELQAARAAQAWPVTSAGGGATAEYDTDQGALELDIEAYLTPPGSAGVDLDTLPLLMPSQKNIDALSAYIAGRMPDFLAETGIPRPPASVSFDRMGQIELPEDYPYAAQFKRALAENPVMERALRTTSALASHMVEMRKSMPFQQEYAAATSPAEIAAVLAKYRHLFSAYRHYDSIALNFTSGGSLRVTHDGKPLAEV